MRRAVPRGGIRTPQRAKGTASEKDVYDGNEEEEEFVDATNLGFRGLVWEADLMEAGEGVEKGSDKKCRKRDRLQVTTPRVPLLYLLMLGFRAFAVHESMS